MQSGFGGGRGRRACRRAPRLLGLRQSPCRDGMMTRFPAPALLVLLLSACATFPDAVGKASGPVAAPPTLLPVEDILAQGDALEDGSAVIGPLEARTAALRARAARLRSQ